MPTDLKTWTKGLFSLTGSALAGPTGGLIGTLAGGLIASILPGASDFLGKVFSRMASDTLDRTSKNLLGKLDPVEKRRINHDLQIAFRDACREAIYDLGGERCFPQVWRERPREVPTALQYLVSSEGNELWQDQDPLAEQVCHFFKEMLNAIAEQRLLPLDPPLEQPAASVYTYLDAETPQALNEAFYNTIILPFFNGFGTLRSELPEFETYLRRYLLDRALVHLGEMLKTRSPAWCAYNRLMLEELRSQVRQITSSQDEILQRLDDLVDQPGGPALIEWSDGLADLLSATGCLEKQVSEGFEAVLARMSEGQNETLLRFSALLSASVRIEEKIDRVLRILEDGRYVIEGTPSVAIDESPAPGEPPFKGLQYFTEADAELFFGREQLTARLLSRLRLRPGGSWPTPASRRAIPGTGNFLAVIGASGSGKSSVVRAGLIPALQSGLPLADGDLPPAGSERWPVHVLTPTSQPLAALAASLTRHSTSAAITTTLIDDLRQDPRSLGVYVLKLLDSSAQGKGKKKRARADQLLLVVDQFEEIFTLCREEADRQAFIDNLLAAVESSPVLLVLALRADFYAQCARYENLRQAIAASQEYIGPMSAAEMRRAIEQPAVRNGWEFEHGLVSLILHDLGAGEGETGEGRPPEPGALPLLSHALLETWKHRRGQVMTLESYAESGGVRGAIAKTAETVFFQRLNLNQQAIARNIFLRLTQPGEGTQDTRRRALLSELTSRPEMAAATEMVLQTLAEARLITIDQESVEVAHEALIREWPALRKWLDEDREGLRLHRQITEAAQDWQRLGNDTGVVYRGARLAQAVEWARAHADQLSPLEQEFIDFSTFIAERDAAAREAQRQREIEAARQLAEEAEARRKAEAARAQLAEEGTRRLRLRNRIITGVSALVVLAAILACIFAGYSLQQKARADRNAELALQNQSAAQAASTQAVAQQITAEAQAHTRATAEADALEQKAAAEAAQAEALRQSRASLSRELAAQSASLTSRDADLSLLLAVEAVRIAREPGMPAVAEAQTSLFHALQAANFSAVLRGHTAEGMLALYSPDGKSILSTSQDGSARLWDIASSQAITIAAYTGGITSATFNQDGSLILTSGYDQDQDGVAELWKPDGSRVAILSGHTGIVFWASFSPDGKLIVTAGQDNAARLWRVDGTLAATLSGHTNWVTAAAFSPDGQRILTLSLDATARLWDTAGEPVATLEGHTQWVIGACFSPDSSRVVTASLDGTARIWLADGTPVTVLEGHSSAVYTAVYSLDGQKIVTASDDSTARLWRSDGRLLAELRGHTSPLYLAIFSPDGAQILTSSMDKTARLWRLDGSLIATLDGHTSDVTSAFFRADGKQIVTSSADATIRVWDFDQLYAPTLASLAVPQMWAGFSPDSQLIAAGGLDNLARVYRLDGALVSTLTGHTSGVTGASFSPDGAMIATASRDGTARIWTMDGALLTELHGHTGPVRSANFSPDSKLVVTAGEDGTARLYHISGSLDAILEGHADVVWSAFFSPDGTRILTASQDGTARIWNLEGQALQTIDNRGVPVNLAAFSPDGQRVLTAGQDGIARLWQPDGTPVASLEGHTQMVNWAAFSPDGKLIATASSDGSVKLWTSDGKLLANVEGHTNWVSCANFSPDGVTLVTAGWDGTVRLWSVFESLEAMQAEAAQRVGRSLTQDECLRYLRQENCPAGP
jgi:WD40 repeat protein